MGYTWNFDEDEYLWQKGVYETVEDCVKEAMKEMREDDYYQEKIFVGEAVLFKPWVSGEDIIAAIEEQALDEVGEASDNWDIYGGLRVHGEGHRDAAYVELSQQLTDVVNKWLKKYNLEPDFYKIVNIQEVAVGGTV